MGLVGLRGFWVGLEDEFVNLEGLRIFVGCLGGSWWVDVGVNF